MAAAFTPRRTALIDRRAKAPARRAVKDPPRGEGIPDVPCTNAIGMVLTQRDANDDEPRTVGDSDATNVIDHVIVLHDPKMPVTRIACGEIKAAK